MEEEGKKKIETKMLIAPLVSVAAFLVLIFGAGYAYFTSTVTMNTANYQINMPSQTSLVCTKTDCNVTITPAMMTTGAVDATNAKGTSTCSVVCTCSGTSGAKCNYTVTLAQTGTNVYGTSAAVSVANEFTSTLTSSGGCSATTANVNTNAAFYGTTAKQVASCSLTAGSTATGTVQAVFKWYNLNGDQSAHANKVYKYALSTTGGTVG